MNNGNKLKHRQQRPRYNSKNKTKNSVYAERVTLNK